MNYITALVIMCLTLTSCSWRVCESRSVELIYKLPTYVIAGGYGDLIKQDELLIPIKSIKPATGVKVKLIPYSQTDKSATVYQREIFKYKDLSKYSTIELDYTGEDNNKNTYKDMIFSKEYNTTLTIELYTEEAASDKSCELAPQYKEVIIADMYNGGSQLYRLKSDADAEDFIRTKENEYLSNFWQSNEDIKKVIETLKGSIKNDNAYDNGHKIYNWITQNISYDHDKKVKAVNEVLRTRKAMCGGYSYLFNALAQYFNLKTLVIIGVGEDEGHAWNVIFDGNTEINVDCTWGTTNPLEYYCIAPGTFPKNHFVYNINKKDFEPFTSFSDLVLSCSKN